jgi:amidase
VIFAIFVLFVVHVPQPSAQRAPGTVGVDLSVADAQRRMTAGTLTSRALTRGYLDRIAAIDDAGPRLNAVIDLNPAALREADARDAERRAGKMRGPLHGIPVLIKDNIDVAGMINSAGSLALVDNRPAADAFLITRLRAAGVVILGRSNLSEWANFRSTKSASGWSGRGGQVRNPYALDRNPCGSSSGTGTAIAANLAAAGVGTETDGSIVCPSSVAGLVGIKPTVGLISRSGVIPISRTQDTAGPMTRTVADAAALLSAMVGEDPRDVATQGSAKHAGDYLKALDANALKGARIGVARKRYFGYSPAADRLVEAAIGVMKANGAVIVDPANIPTAAQLDDCEFEVLLYEFKAGLNEYLAGLGPAAKMKSLSDLIAFNNREKDREMPYFGQEIFVMANKKGPLTDPGYRRERATCRTRARALGIDAVLKKHGLDAIVAPTGSPAWPTDPINGDHFLGASSTPAAVAGYPTITVPAGQAFGLPVGITFIGGAWSEARLIALAYAYEQASKLRRPPAFAAAAPGS